ncbi:glycoside hydrolase family 76 protein [Hypoxylon sp. CI-4A]|nr:glycoside hydrolase family 76 protein [Hypoxylon sp. CI-4A]
MPALLRWTTRCLCLFSLASGQPISSSERDLSAVNGVTQAAVNALMSLYDDETGLWDPHNPITAWWQSGVALWAVTEYMIKSGNHDYLAHAENTVEIQRAPLDWWPEGGGDFRADSTDDTGWWALALTSLYTLTGNEEYLTIAKEDEQYMFDYWNTTTCGGGIIWNIPNRTYHNAISNELYLELTATLHNLIPGDTMYLNRSLREWEWFNSSGIINDDFLINDGLNNDVGCANNGATTWTYNQGVVLGGLVELHKATGEPQYLDTARRIADAAVSSTSTLVDEEGILTEPCASEQDCQPNGTSFKGIFVRELAKLNAALDDRPYQSFLEDNAQLAVLEARNGSNFYGFSWQGPLDTVTIGTQEAAVQLLIAAYL